MSYVHRAFVLGLFAGSVLSCTSLAQAQPLSTLQPQAYFWEPPKAAISLHPKFCPIARVVITSQTATAASIATGGDPYSDAYLPFGLSPFSTPSGFSVKKLRDYYVSKGWLSLDAQGRELELAILLQNVKTVAHKPSSLLGWDEFGTSDPRYEEKIDVDVDNNGNDDPLFSLSNLTLSEYYRAQKHRYRQPWLWRGQQEAGTFWNDFRAALASPASNLVPNRLHLDIEPYSDRRRFFIDSPQYVVEGEFNYTDLALTDAFDARDAYLLYALPHENSGLRLDPATQAWVYQPSPSFNPLQNRWNQMQVPGFGTSTMASLWNEVKGSFNNRDNPLMATGPSINYDPLAPSVFAFGAPNSSSASANHATYIWYAQVCQRALAAAHTQTAVNSMKLSFPNLKGSNYEMMTMSPGVQDFGWHQPVPAGASGTPQPFVRLGERGYKDSGNHGSNIATLSQSPGYDWINYHELERLVA